VVCAEVEATQAGETVAHAANRAAASHPGSDLALVLGNVMPPDGWLARLQDCAARESTIATVSSLPATSIEGTRPELSRSEPRLLADVSDCPRIDLVAGACVLIARPAFDLLGGLDETMPSGTGAAAELGLRARQRGFANLLAADLLVPLDLAAGLTDPDRAALARRFPMLWQAALDPPSEAVERSLALARTAGRKLSVTIDARSLGANAGGTQVYALELIRALAQTGDVDIRALIGPDPEAQAQLEALDVASVITYEQALEGLEATDVVHRPQQVFTLDDLQLLRPLGQRLVITHLDLIAYHNPAYFQDLSNWRRHVRATRIAHEAADHLLFASAHAMRDAEREDLIEARRASIVPLGVDRSEQPDAPITRPAALGELSEPFLLCIGADYAHKNRPFALQLTAELRRAHGWSGMLVLTGAHVPHGSSAGDELRVIESEPQLEHASVDLGSTSEAERRWLMTHASAIVYPTVFEGFGLVPFEAAAVGVPCLFAHQSSLGELLPCELATLDGWDPARAARLAIGLLDDGPARRQHVEKLREVARAHSWELCAQRTTEAYRRAQRSPLRASARQAWEALQREQEIVRLDRAVADMGAEHDSFRASIGTDGIDLVGPEGLLSATDRRTLLALASRPTLSGPLFAAGRAGYRLAHRRKGRQ
jgi:glycosyltransferase involved in cell wall biosynthesis